MKWPGAQHAEFLEQELVRVREEHARHVADLKNTYESLLTRAIEENARLRDDNARLQRVAVPEVKNVQLPGDPEPPPPPPVKPSAPRTFQEALVQHMKTTFPDVTDKQFIGFPGQPITPEKKEKPDVGQTGKAS